MTRTILKFGFIAGVILSSLMAITVPLCLNGTVSDAFSEVFGYTTMVLAFIVMFFGIRSYRDNVAGGRITFGKAFRVGILMTLIVSAIYVTSWEIIYHTFLPDFPDRYAALVIEKARSTGATGEAIAAKQREMAAFKKMYANPLYNVALTLLEVFPVGLIMTLISAAILRRKSTAQPPAAIAATSGA